MDATPDRYAYRCLPLSIANMHGWEVLCQAGFTAVWNGADGLGDISVRTDDGAAAPAISHFGCGILTFHVPCLFRTEPEFDLVVTGPINLPKDGIAALTGVVETDWSPYSFTMNWRFTRPGEVRFDRGEPFALLMPVRRGQLEEFEPEVHRLSDDPELKAQHDAWQASRGGFLEDLHHPGSRAVTEKWQKGYHRGLMPGGEPEPTGTHRTRLTLKPFPGM